MNRFDKPLSVAILGGGVIGVTTGILLNLHGIKTKIYTEYMVDEMSPSDKLNNPPELASIFAAASVIPHYVDHPKAKDILDISQKFFHRLAFSAGAGVRVQRHYEVFEKPTETPEDRKIINDFTLLPADGKGFLADPNIPHRNGADGAWGWHFNVFFAEVPTYLRKLYELYIASGGIFVQGKLKNVDEFLNLKADVLINCGGRWATEFFPEDKNNTKILKGHLVKINIFQVPHDKKNQYFSYNYLPEMDIYHKKDNNGKRLPTDVYFYPRSDGWVFGGSNLEGYPDVGEAWRDEDQQIAVETFKKPEWDIEIPKPIWELNRELINNITGVDITDSKYVSFPYAGYRFVRTPIRIEKGGHEKGKLLLHNYGHGGSGYTLSWGSAHELIKIIEGEFGSDIYRFKKRNIRKSFTLSLLSILEDLAQEEYYSRIS